MRGINANGILATMRTNWREIARWAILLAYFGIIYFMASHLWHALNFFTFMTILIAMPFLVMVSFAYLEEHKAKE